MSTYVIADIHGHFETFQRMLDLIGFSENDELILAGDYIDRGRQNLEMLRFITQCPENILLIKGNHDAEFAECIGILNAICKKNSMSPENRDDARKAYEIVNEAAGDYFDYYGTIRELIMESGITLKELRGFAKVINEMPLYYRLTVNKMRYLVVHAGYCEDEKLTQEQKEHFCLYARDEAYTIGGISDTTIIAGHTPTILPDEFVYTGGDVFYYHDRQKNRRFYDIDCGCAYRESSTIKNGRLACIRLQDEELYYVSKEDQSRI